MAKLGRPPRYVLVEVLHNRGNGPIAHIRDTKGFRNFYIRLKGQRYVMWDRLDAPIPDDDQLRRVAREALK